MGDFTLTLPYPRKIGKLVLLFALLIIFAARYSSAQASFASDRPRYAPGAYATETLPQAPEPALLRESTPHIKGEFNKYPQTGNSFFTAPVRASVVPLPPLVKAEPFHWKGLLWQSLAFQALEHGPRLMAADAEDRHILLNKPFWTDYWASLSQFNMGRWNDGDSFIVNYIGHPAQGAVSGYIEVQNDPRGRNVRFANDRRYWNSRFRAFLWSTAYSIEFEIGPISEASIFNQGGYTYPLGCKEHDRACEKTARYTNNTGWVDFIVTPIGGSLFMIAGDAADRYILDPLITHHPHSFRYKVLRSSVNMPRSLANLLAGRVPWYRDYEHPLDASSLAGLNMERADRGERIGTGDFQIFYSSLSLPDSKAPCHGCRRWSNGMGAELGIRIARHADAVAVVRKQSSPGSFLPPASGGSLGTAHFGLRSGIAGKHFALRGSLAPGFASYSSTRGNTPGGRASGPPKRIFQFSFLAAISGDLRVTSHLALRATVEQMVIRYKSPYRDPPGIGTPPRLSFLSHDNYINSTHWGIRIGPVIGF